MMNAFVLYFQGVQGPQGAPGPPGNAGDEVGSPLYLTTITRSVIFNFSTNIPEHTVNLFLYIRVYMRYFIFGLVFLVKIFCPKNSCRNVESTFVCFFFQGRMGSSGDPGKNVRKIHAQNKS